MATKVDCIRAAARAGATPEEAVALVENMFKEKAALEATGVVAGVEKKLAAAVEEMAEASRVQGILQRKQTALTIRRRAEVDAAIATMRADGASFGDAMTALLVGSGKRFAGARASVANRKSGITLEWSGGMLRELENIEGALDLLHKDKSFGVEIHREMLEPGATGNPMARQTADVFTRHLENMRVRLNDAGANIGRIENYAPQSHAPERLLKAGETAWTNFVAERLDFERSFPGVTDAAERLSILSEVYHNIITGQSRRIGTGSAEGAPKIPRNMASALGRERVLHFKEAAGALEYHESFGTGNITQGIIGQLQKRSGKLALMEVFGPNPELMIQNIMEGERHRLRSTTEDEIRAMVKGRKATRLEKIEKNIEAARRGGNEEQATSSAADWQREVMALRGKLVADVSRMWDGRGFGGIANYYAVLSGAAGTPVNPTLARRAANVRAVQSMAKLGGAFLSSISDVFVKAVNLRHNGENLLGAWKNAIDIRVQGLQPKERVQFGRALGVYSNTMIGEIYNRFDIVDGPSGGVTRAMNTFFKLSGLEAWTEGHKASYTMYLSHRLGRTVGEEFGGINVDFAASLRKHGLDRRWQVLRKMAREEINGEIHILPERAYELPEADFEYLIPEQYREGNGPELEIPGKRRGEIPAEFERRLAAWDTARARALLTLENESPFQVPERRMPEAREDFEARLGEWQASRTHAMAEIVPPNYTGPRAERLKQIKKFKEAHLPEDFKRAPRQVGGEKDAAYAARVEKARRQYDRELVARLPDDLRQRPQRAAMPESYAQYNDKLERRVEAHENRREIWYAARERELMRARRDTATSLMGYYADETRYAILEPDEKVRAAMYGGSRPGTGWGEFRRFMLQFKSWPVSYTTRFLMEGRWNKASMGRPNLFNLSTYDGGGMFHAAVSGLLFGYLAGAAKDIVKGKQPRSPDRLETWLAAFMQAGGAGILGDFMMGSKDRFGNQATANILGPIPTQLANFFTITGQMVRGELQGAGEDALRLAIDNTPYINLWYTRAALDYLLLFHIREALSPGTLARTERRMQQEFNQQYLQMGGIDMTPSKIIRRGGGFR